MKLCLLKFICIDDIAMELHQSQGHRAFDEGFKFFYCLFLSEQMAQKIRNVVITQNHQDNLRCQLFPQPLLSSLMSDCIAKGMDLSEGGCRYNFSGFQGIGLATAADSLAAVKKLVFEEKSLDKRELLSALGKNFEGYEVLRQRLLNDAPKWGNDDYYVDDIAIAIVEAYRQEVNKYTNFRGGKFIPALWSFYVNIDFGRGLGASADGRKAGEPVSHSIGPSTGAAANGPTAILKSCAKLPHRRMANGTSLLLDFQPFLLRKKETLATFTSLVKSAMSLSLMQLHCNIINTDKLEEAKLHPELYGDLIVRVAGYSDYFVRLSESLQNFVLERSKHEI
jgi:formate C-acetyltransferase